MSDDNLITKDDPRHAAAQKVLDAMQEFFNLDPWGGAVRWIEGSDGRVVIFTRGEYRQRIMSAVKEYPQPTLMFEQLAGDDEPEGDVTDE